MMVTLEKELGVTLDALRDTFGSISEEVAARMVDAMMHLGV